MPKTTTATVDTATANITRKIISDRYNYPLRNMKDGDQLQSLKANFTSIDLEILLTVLQGTCQVSLTLCDFIAHHKTEFGLIANRDYNKHDYLTADGERRLCEQVRVNHIILFVAAQLQAARLNSA